MPPTSRRSVSACSGPSVGRPTRRELLRAGLVGFTGLSLGDLYRLQAQASEPSTSERTAIILVWLRGGASHLETFDPKPLAPLEYRGPYKPIPTNVTGIHICELLPRLAKIADKYALLRSIAHTGPGHPAGSLQMLSGDTDAPDKDGPAYPDWMSIANYLRSDRMGTLPNYVAVNPIDRYDSFKIAGPTYLGQPYEAFQVTGNPDLPDFVVPGIHVKDQQMTDRITQRAALKETLGGLRRGIDSSGLLESLDAFQAQALNLLTSAEARAAFDLSKEADQVRERYGRNQWGQQCLMARRLVEAGVEIVATEFDGPLCGRVQNWDDHAVNHHVFDAMKFRAPFFDQAVSALIEDVYQRGLDKKVLVVVAGEFGRTPQISHVASSGKGEASAAKGIVQPGRNHWPRANSILFSGGGIETGQVIGATDVRGEDPIDRRVNPGDFLATIYKHLDLEVNNAELAVRVGQPSPSLHVGKPIAELARTS